MDTHIKIPLRRAERKDGDRGAYLPTEDEIKARAAEVREDWSPKQYLSRAGFSEDVEVSIPQYGAPDLLEAMCEAATQFGAG